MGVQCGGDLRGLDVRMGYGQMLHGAGNGDVGMGDAITEPEFASTAGAVSLERGQRMADLGAAADHPRF